MRPATRGLLVALACIAFLPAQAALRDEVDPALAQKIASLPLVDVHTHIEDPEIATPPGDPEDPVGPTPFAYPLRLQRDNPEHLEAWAALFGYRDGDFAVEHLRALRKVREQVRRERGDGYPAWILDQSNTATAFINTAALFPNTPAPRFRLVVFFDSLLMPFGGGAPVDWALQRVGLKALPPTLDGYVRQVIDGYVHDARTQPGAVAMKTTIAYYRSLAVGLTDARDAAAIYARLRRGAKPDAADYKRLQDYLIRMAVIAAGREQLPVHIHTGVGADPWFSIATADPLLLEPLITDPSVRKTNFVLIHGGWPFEKSTGVMLLHPNVYVDFSAQTFLRYDRAIADSLRAWLEFMPDHVMIGTDAYGDGSPVVGWEELHWLGARTARTALGAALSGMLRDGEISRAKAEAIAEDVMSATARRLHHLDTH